MHQFNFMEIYTKPYTLHMAMPVLYIWESLRLLSWQALNGRAGTQCNTSLMIVYLSTACNGKDTFNNPGHRIFYIYQNVWQLNGIGRCYPKILNHIKPFFVEDYRNHFSRYRQKLITLAKIKQNIGEWIWIRTEQQ